MASSKRRVESPSRTIVAQIRARILSGELGPGDRVPSVRQIARRWGVAVAPATRVTATLRDEGLVETTVGSGTVVSAAITPATPQAPPTPAAPSGPGASASSSPRHGVRSEQALNREHVLHAAIEIADAEGLYALSMRRLAAHLGVGPMSLYRHVSNKDELLLQIADAVAGELDLPEPGPDGWRAKLELVARQQWQLCRRHLWLPRVVSFTRPLFAPNLMAHTEWTLRALDGLGLSVAIRLREAITLHALVSTIALSLAEEVEAEQDTGMTLEGWTETQRARAHELLGGGRFPLLAATAEETAPGLDDLFEYGLARHLDGFAVLVDSGAGRDGAVN